MSGEEFGLLIAGVVIGWMVLRRLPLIGLLMRLVGVLVLVASPVVLVLVGGAILWFSVVTSDPVSTVAAVVTTKSKAEKLVAPSEPSPAYVPTRAPLPPRKPR